MKKVLITVFISVLFQRLDAQEKTFTREYSYKASELDSKNSCRTIAKTQLRQNLLEEIGVYIESEQILKTSEVDNKFRQDFRENISTVTAGITKMEVLDEKWDGENYWMKASITVDPTSLQQTLKQIIEDRKRTKELESLKLQLSESLKKIEDLKKEFLRGNNKNTKSEISKKYDKEILSVSREFPFFGKRIFNLNPVYTYFKLNGDSVKCRRTPLEVIHQLQGLELNNTQMASDRGHLSTTIVEVEDF